MAHSLDDNGGVPEKITHGELWVMGNIVIYLHRLVEPPTHDSSVLGFWVATAFVDNKTERALRQTQSKAVHLKVSEYS